MTTKRIMGPGMDPSEVAIDIPSFIQITTPEQAAEFQAFISRIIASTQENCLERLAETIQQQNVLWTDLAKQLGAKDA